jgi:hypothetical protein
MVAHDPSRLPLAKDVRFTEDSQELKPGDGVWKTATKKGDFRQDYIDLKKQIAATHVMVFEENVQVLYSVVLRVADQKITGIETLVDRITPNSRFKPDSLDKASAGMSGVVPAGKRMQRAEMIRGALLYPNGLRIGSFVHPDVKPSVAAVDEEEGLVLLWMNFGDTNSYGAGNALVTFEAFKVWGGEIHAINAFFRILPKDMQRGWPAV